ncbi:MAG TPA: DNA topoisomerase IB [Mycobacteriales bacterium]
MTRLRRSDCAGRGFRRVRRGRGFSYLDDEGRPITDPDVRARIEALVLPPAWKDVWICPWPNGHIQATGVDAAGRRQYRYHDVWRTTRDRAKHERVLEVAARLPAARETFAADLARPGMPRARVLAAAARLLDLGFFRIGSEQYEEENGTFGLTTLHRRHVTVSAGRVTFDYVAKSGQHRMTSIADPAVIAVVETLRRRRFGPEHLLACKEGRRWRELDADDVNAYLRETIVGPKGDLDVSAKDFRTWHGTVLMAVALAVNEHPAGPSAAKRMLARAYAEVAFYLGNTPAVARSSYVDPRVVDLWRDRVTIRAALDDLGDQATVGEPATQGAVEAAVLDLLAR